MLSVTEGACEYLANMLDETNAPEGVAARCVIQEGDLRLVPGSEEPGDIVFRHDDRPVLLVTKAISESLEGREFDVEEQDDGARLMIR